KAIVVAPRNRDHPRSRDGQSRQDRQTTVMPPFIAKLQSELRRQPACMRPTTHLLQTENIRPQARQHPHYIPSLSTNLQTTIQVPTHHPHSHFLNLFPP